jgi:hypothetical protein
MGVASGCEFFNFFPAVATALSSYLLLALVLVQHLQKPRYFRFYMLELFSPLLQLL